MRDLYLTLIVMVLVYSSFPATAQKQSDFPEWAMGPFVKLDQPVLSPTSESVFNFLQGRLMGKVFLDPDRLTFERYILPLLESVVVTPLRTQVPSQRIDGIATPKLEKILVDMFVDDEIFFAFQGDELAHIYETAFMRYRISQKSIFRYAERRNAEGEIRDFIQQKTKIQLIGSASIH